MPLRSSEDAINLIIREEDSDEHYYERHYQHFEWPEGASGPTIGIGYDCGYSTASEAITDWQAYVDQNTLDHIVKACGLKGESAHAFVRAHGASVTIPWDKAIAQFKGRELPKWEATTQAHLTSRAQNLNGDCFGALVSIAYNRGPSFNAPGARYAEMRAIYNHIMTGNLKAIPDDILSMRRLWPKGGDLWNRRTHEATLFTRGLQHNGGLL